MLISRRALALLVLTTSAACSAVDSSPGAGGAAAWGGQGATSYGGSSASGGSTTSVGGGVTGGTTVVSSSGTGGVTTATGGGPGTGGSVPTGGVGPTGGVATGGRATGGVSTGGVATGGVGTGGVGGIDALRPMGSEVCGKDGEVVTLGYIVRSNKWTESAGGDLCVTALADPGRTYSGFDITSCSINSTVNDPGAYPSMVAGWHYTLKAAGHGLPKKVSEATSIITTWNYKAPTGKHNVSYDIWLHPQTNVDNPDGGMEFMIWVANSGDVRPAGSQVGNASLAGGSWEIWTSTISSQGYTWKYVAYKRTANLNSFEDLDILPMLKDAVSKGYLDAAWNILGIEAGFEIWNGGCSGAGTKYYSVMVN
jgi:hypothetical protein